MSTSTASNRRPGASGSKPAAAAASAKKSPWTRRQRGSPVSSGPSGTSPLRCQSMTAASVSTTSSDPTCLVLQHGGGRVAEPEPAHHDVEIAAGESGQSQPGQRDLRSREQARHQEVLAELDLEDVDAEPQLAPAPQAERADRRFPVVQLLEQRAHAVFPCARVAAGGDPDHVPGAAARPVGAHRDLLHVETGLAQPPGETRIRSR